MDLEYKITTTAELAGAEAAADALERQIGKAKALKQDYSALEAQLKTMRGSIDEAKAAHLASGDAMIDEGKKTSKLELGKKELLESIRGLTREYPMLGEVAKAVFNPIVLIAFSAIAAYEIWTSRVKTLTTALGGVELPDLGGHIDEAQNVAEAYDGIAKAITEVDEAAASGAAIYERQSKAINAQLTAMTALINAQKQKAIADLDIEKAGGNMTDADYAAKKSRIETGASDATVQAEINARDADLQARKAEAARQAAEASAKAKAAGAFKLPSDDKAAQAGADEFKDIAAARKAEADAAEQRVKEIQEFIAAREAGLRPRLGSFLKAVGLATKYGANTDPEEAAKMEQEAASKAREQQRAAEKSAATREKEIADRAKVRQEAEAAAAAAEKTKLGLAGEDDPNQIGSVAWQNAQARKTQATNNNTAAKETFAGDINRGNQDVATINDIGSKANQTAGDAAKVATAIKDAHAAVADAGRVIGILANAGEDTAQLKAEVAKLWLAVQRAQAAADQK